MVPGSTAVLIASASSGSGFDTGQVVVAAAALAVGLMTVYTANNRHRQQLDHDRLLRAEELEHDREMRRRDHIRDSVDSAMEAVNEATLALARLAGSLSVAEEDRDRLEAVLEDERAGKEERERAGRALDAIRQDLQDPLNAAHYGTMEMITNQSRLSVRLGHRHPVVQAAEEAATCYRRLYDNLRAGLERNRTQQERDFEEKYVRETIDPKAQAFMSECEKWFQVPEAFSL